MRPPAPDPARTGPHFPHTPTVGELIAILHTAGGQDLSRGVNRLQGPPVLMPSDRV
jgi:hypothetical protein